MISVLDRNRIGLRDQLFGRLRKTSRRTSQRNHYRPRIEGLEDRKLLALIVSEFPTALAAGASPSQITTGPDGNLWFTENGANKIGVMKPDGSLVTEIALPAGSGPEGITTGPDGNIWFTEAGTSKIGHVTTAGSLFPEITLPVGSQPFVITTGPDNNIWFTEFGTDKIGHVTTAGSLFPEITLPAGSGPVGITTGPDGNLWYTDFSSSKIGHVTTAGSLFPEVTLPATSIPEGIVTGSDNNLWFAEFGTGKVGHISTAGSLFPEVTLSAANGPRFIAAAPDGNLYVTESGNGKIAQITTAGTLNEQAVNVTLSAPRGITVGPNGNVYFADQGTNKIGQVITANFVSGALDVASDTGVSSTDFITNDNTPTFKGKTKGGAFVLIVAQGLTHPSEPIAFGFANADGSWSLTSRALPDDSYQISAQSIDGGGGGATALVPLTSATKPLVISTLGPVITSVVYNAGARLITITFKSAVGLDPTTLTAVASYSVSGKGASIASITSSTAGTNTIVVLTLSAGKKLPKKIQLTVLASAIRDLAGNALDGEFLGKFPTGDLRPGGNFSATLPIKIKKTKTSLASPALDRRLEAATHLIKIKKTGTSLAHRLLILGGSSPISTGS